MTDRLTLLRQRELLENREGYLHDAMPEQERQRIDNETLSMLREKSAGRLQPILIQRNNSDWIAAYLIQDIGDDGKRILFRGDKWRIFRARKSAKVVTVESTQLSSFNDLIRIQEDYAKRMYAMISEVKLPTTRKVKKCPKIKTGMA